MTLLAIVGPGLIVMTGDNDAGAFSTYSQAGQDYGYSLLWTLLLMLPVLYVNQEMVIRLGAVTGVGHARLILERFGKFWGAFSVIDLFLLNALTTVSEFIGVNLGLQYLGVPKIAGVLVAACVIIGAASTGDFRRFERFAMCLIFFSFLLVPFLRAGAPAARPGGQWLLRAADAACALGRPGRRAAARHWHYRHHFGALAAFLSAELCDRQTHHPALHQIFAR